MRKICPNEDEPNIDKMVLFKAWLATHFEGLFDPLVELIKLSGKGPHISRSIPTNFGVNRSSNEKDMA